MILVNDLKDHPKNRNKHGSDQIERLAELYNYQGVRHPIIVSKKSGFIVAGHGRKLAAIRAGLKEMPVVYQDFESDAQEYAFIQSDNAIALWADLDIQGIKTDSFELGPDFDFKMLGLKDFEIDSSEFSEESKEEKVKLSDKFMVPPFSVLNAREGWWQDRKRQWISLGIKSEEGRDAPAGGSPDLLARMNGDSGTSIFDPVVCELVYIWFSKEMDIVIDPFAGGSVRGIVAGKLNRKYLGHELRKEQVEANILQAKKIEFKKELIPEWFVGDSRKIDESFSDKKADLIFSCPPYADLEVYSKDKNDLSNMDYDDFKKAYFEIIKKSCKLLKENSFAVFVVGEVRDKHGNYYNFVSDTINAFLDAGLNYYNEAILVTPCGAVAMRAGNSFSKSRKLGKTHQNILMFVKGSGKLAAQKCGQIEINLDQMSDGAEIA